MDRMDTFDTWEENPDSTLSMNLDEEDVSLSTRQSGFLSEPRRMTTMDMSKVTASLTDMPTLSNLEEGIDNATIEDLNDLDRKPSPVIDNRKPSPTVEGNSSPSDTHPGLPEDSPALAGFPAAAATAMRNNDDGVDDTDRTGNDAIGGRASRISLSSTAAAAGLKSPPPPASPGAISMNSDPTECIMNKRHNARSSVTSARSSVASRTAHHTPVGAYAARNDGNDAYSHKRQSRASGRQSAIRGSVGSSSLGSSEFLSQPGAVAMANADNDNYSHKRASGTRASHSMRPSSAASVSEETALAAAKSVAFATSATGGGRTTAGMNGFMGNARVSRTSRITASMAIYVSQHADDSDGSDELDEESELELAQPAILGAVAVADGSVERLSKGSLTYSDRNSTGSVRASRLQPVTEPEEADGDVQESKDEDSSKREVLRHRTNPEKQKSRRTFYYMVGAALFAVIVGVAVVILLVVGGSDTDMDQPTEAPTLRQGLLQSDVRTFLIAEQISSVQDFEDPGSPQSLALDWIALEDVVLSRGFDDDMITRYVLAVYYFSLDGPEWLFGGDDGAYLNNALDVCDWSSVECSNGKVEKIAQREFNNMKGTLPAELNAIPSLVYLSILNNQIEGLAEPIRKLGKLSTRS